MNQNRVKPKAKKKTRFLYSREAVNDALAAIKDGMSINTASLKYHIPRSTLCSKKKNKHADKRPGPDTVLTVGEENSLVDWVFNCSNLNMPVSKQHVLNSVALLVKILDRENPFANGRPGRHWYQSFLRRNEKVVDRIKENSTISKISPNEDSIKIWFSNLRTFLTQKNLLNIDPTRIFTTETVPLTSPDVKNDQSNLLVQVTGNAAGILAPSMIMYNFQRIPVKIYENMPKGWIYCKSENGLMSAENFYEYITMCFQPWLIENKVSFPIILFINGRVPYLTLSLSDYCLREKIELIALFPNASQILQPLQVSMFPLLKASWHSELVEYRSQTKIFNLLKENVSSMLKDVFDNLDVLTILKGGFKACGLYPLTETVINYKEISKKVVQKIPTERIEFTPFVPHNMFTPSVNDHIAFIPNDVFTPTVDVSLKKIFCFMEQTLDTEKLYTFKSVSDLEEWTGKIEDTALFYFWRKIKNLCQTDSRDNFSMQTNFSSAESIENAETDNLSGVTGLEEEEIVLSNDMIIEDPRKICVTEMNDV